MRQVPGAKLWIGSGDDPSISSAITEAEIAAVVDLAKGDKPPSSVRGPLFLHVPLVDNAGNSPELLRKAIDAVAALVRDDVPTLVYCNRGLSRSAAIAAAALAKAHDKDANETASALCRDLDVDVSVALWMDLLAAIDYQEKPITGAKDGRPPGSASPAKRYESDAAYFRKRRAD